MPHVAAAALLANILFRRHCGDALPRAHGFFCAVCFPHEVERERVECGRGNVVNFARVDCVNEQLIRFSSHCAISSIMAVRGSTAPLTRVSAAPPTTKLQASKARLNAARGMTSSPRRQGSGYVGR